jgi:hypothetical protein
VTGMNRDEPPESPQFTGLDQEGRSDVAPDPQTIVSVEQPASRLAVPAVDVIAVAARTSSAARQAWP